MPGFCAGGERGSSCLGRSFAQQEELRFPELKIIAQGDGQGVHLRQAPLALSAARALPAVTAAKRKIVANFIGVMERELRRAVNAAAGWTDSNPGFARAVSRVKFFVIEVRYDRGVYLPQEDLWLDPLGPKAVRLCLACPQRSHRAARRNHRLRTNRAVDAGAPAGEAQRTRRRLRRAQRRSAVST